MLKYIRVGNLCSFRGGGGSATFRIPELDGVCRAAAMARSFGHLKFHVYAGRCGLFITLSRSITVVKSSRDLHYKRFGVAASGLAVCVTEFLSRPAFRFLPSFLPALPLPCLPCLPSNFAIVINDNDSGTSFRYSPGIIREMQNGHSNGSRLSDYLWAGYPADFDCRFFEF